MGFAPMLVRPQHRLNPWKATKRGTDYHNVRQPLGGRIVRVAVSDSIAQFVKVDEGLVYAAMGAFALSQQNASEDNSRSRKLIAHGPKEVHVTQADVSRPPPMAVPMTRQDQ